jgi:hypothetical protein
MRILMAALILGAGSMHAVAGNSYDGSWTVNVMTSAGNCQATAPYPVTVSDGNISGPAAVSGRVGNAGLVRASIQGAVANGQLNGSKGSGRWSSASSGVPCSGRWNASKH